MAGESFEFRAVVLDRKGCTASDNPNWSLETEQAGVTLSPLGRVELADSVPEGEIQIHAAIGDQSVQVTIEVASKERYDALLATNAFNAEGESAEAAAVAIASASIGAEEVVAEDGAGGRKLLFIVLVSIVAIALGIGGAFMVMRTRRAHKKREQEEQDEHDRAMAIHEEAKAKAERAQLEHKQLVMEHQAKLRKKVCPVCGNVFSPDKKFCGSDGTLLVPMNQ
jgi:hypothetical protein